MQRNGDGSQVVSLTIPAEPRWLALCRLVLAGLCRLGPVDDEVLADLKLAVTEACSNSVRHAYGEDGAAGLVEHPLRALAARRERRGRRRRPRLQLRPRPCRSSPLSPTRSSREDEMGLAIIHALVDEVEIGAGPEGRGTKIAFTKYL